MSDLIYLQLSDPVLGCIQCIQGSVQKWIFSCFYLGLSEQINVQPELKDDPWKLKSIRHRVIFSHSESNKSYFPGINFFHSVIETAPFLFQRGCSHSKQDETLSHGASHLHSSGVVFFFSSKSEVTMKTALLFLFKLQDS